MKSNYILLGVICLALESFTSPLMAGNEVKHLFQLNCADEEIAKLSGGQWVCAMDNDTIVTDVNVANTPDVNVVSLPSVVIIDERVQIYTDDVSGDDDTTSPDTLFFCDFAVPEGKILQIEKVSGFSRKGDVLNVGIQPTGSPALTTYRIPRTVLDNLGNYIFEADGGVYAPDGLGSVDFRVLVETDGTSSDSSVGGCTVDGRLFDI